MFFKCQAKVAQPSPRFLAFAFCLIMIQDMPSSWSLEISGRLQWAEKRALSFPVSGVIQKVRVHVGDYVKAGEILATIEPASYNARAKAARAVLVQRTSEQKEAKRELQRNQVLYDQTLLANRDLQQAEIQLAKAHAAYSKAQAELTQAQWELDHSVLRAPFSALVLERRAEPAETTIAHCQAPVVLVLAKKGQMLALAQVEEVVLQTLQLGQKATILLGKQSLVGQVLRIGQQPIAEGKKSIQYAVEVAISTPPAKGARAGQVVRIKFKE